MDSSIQKELMQSIKRQAEMVDTFFLPDYVRLLEGIEHTVAQLRTKGIRISKESMTKMAGFDPWEYRRIEERRVKHAYQLLDDIKTGRKSRPNIALINTLRWLKGKHVKVGEKSALLADTVGKYLLLVIEEKESNSSNPDEFDFYFDLKLELQEILEPMPFGDDIPLDLEG